MVNADEYYGNYLKGEDITEDITVTIKSIVPEKIENEEKLTIEFHEIERKTLVLNKTNKDRLKEFFGTSETDKWIDKQIILTTENAFNPSLKKDAPAIRVKKKEGA